MPGTVEFRQQLFDMQIPAVQSGVSDDDCLLPGQGSSQVRDRSAERGRRQTVDHHDVLRLQSGVVGVQQRATVTSGRTGAGDVHLTERRPPQWQAVQRRGGDMTDDSLR